uniref:receptor-like protein EIX1 n=1 Tax=Erigeron canadensis TaxID=72917 RepID=UPI001CB8A8F5|nr:receptor-like protein EIX1 [Erigeron canadensis]
MITASSNITCNQRERQSLLEFREGLSDNSNRLSTWTGLECCEWEGVGCGRRHGHVVKLDLRSPLSTWNDHPLYTNKLLEGKVSPSLINLEHLRYLDLSMNNFSGQNIPEFFGSFKYLEYLDLSYSGFSGVVPPHLGNLSRLQYLNLNVADRYEVSLIVKDDLRWVSLLLSLKHLDLSGITIGKHIDWFHPVNMLPSLLTLNLTRCDINIPSIKSFNFTSLNSLDLYGNNITSTIPVWLSNLTSLVILRLKENNFHGRIPDSIGNLSSLSLLSLSYNQLSGPIPLSLGGLSSLRELALYENQLSGSIPESIGQLSMLEKLYLECNKLSGSIPESIGQLTRLQVLALSDNQLSGSIPESIGQLTRLQVLALYDNQLSGSIPESIGQLSMLEKLYLDDNQLSGSIPESIGQLSMLEKLYLVCNKLSGSIPESIGQLTRLQVLALDFNQLSGSIPASLGQLSNLQYLSLWGNQLSGVVSEIHFTKLNNLTWLRLEDNPLTLNVSPRWIPPFQLKFFLASSCNIGPRFPSLIRNSTHLEVLHLSNSSIRDRIPEWFESISSHLRDLDLSDNQISGNLPRILGSTNLPHSGLLYVILNKNRFTGSVQTHLCELLSIKVLDLSDNNFSGVLPKCLGSLIQLQAMDLTCNTITGAIPNSLGSLLYLRSLHLGNNKFEGNLPVVLQNLTNLVTFDIGNNLLTGNIPYWIGKKLSKLKILNLHSNKFMGKIPLELCQNNDLQYLNLANNNLTGTVPHCFCNLTGMIMINDKFVNYDIDIVNNSYIQYNSSTRYEESIVSYIKGIQLKYTKNARFLISLDLSSNRLIGEIPDVLMKLVALKNLNLSRNLLSGQIPITIGNLKQMESLDLSANKLSGQIPSSLSSLNFLSYLNLSFNNLSGPVPTGNHLETLGDPYTIYEGNIELCGSSLLRSCKKNNSSDAHAGKNEGNEGSQGWSWFYAGMVSGFVVGFMGLVGSLHFIRIWRVTYFEMMENVYTFLMISIMVTLARLRRKIFE